MGTLLNCYKVSVERWKDLRIYPAVASALMKGDELFTIPSEIENQEKILIKQLDHLREKREILSCKTTKH